MIEFYWARRTTGCARRQVVCVNAETFRLFWPYFFSRAVPAARPLCQWAAKRGAAAHGALRLQYDKVKGCQLIVTRDVAAGRALLSLPLRCALYLDHDAGTHDGLSSTPSLLYGCDDSPLRYLGHVEQLAACVVRHLHNRRSPFRRYTELLYDLYNVDGDVDSASLTMDDALDLLTSGTPCGGRARRGLRERLELLCECNVLRPRGVPNAPFLSRRTIHSPRERVTLVRVQELLRRLQQSVPHFAAPSVPWAVSMVLSRAMSDDTGGLTMYPLIDFCSHSFAPTACLELGTSAQENAARGVRWHAADGGPCIHLRTRRALRRGDEVTLLYSTREVRDEADAEYWKVRWGFIPQAKTASEVGVCGFGPSR